MPICHVYETSRPFLSVPIQDFFFQGMPVIRIGSVVGHKPQNGSRWLQISFQTAIKKKKKANYKMQQISTIRFQY